MKKLLSILITSVMLLSAALPVLAMDAARFDWTPESTEYEPIPRDDNLIARIVIGSDVHIGDIYATPKLENAYKAIGMLGGADALVLAGDLTDNGREAQLRELQRIISENSKVLTVEVDGFTGTAAGDGAPVDTTIAMLGNHEYFDGTTTEETYSRFRSIIGQDIDKLYWIAGKVPLIKISMTSSSYKDNYVEKHDFLEAALKEVENTGYKGHIFVVSHMGVMGTVVGAPGANDNPYSDETVALFAKYPQIIHVSGHSHQITMNPAFIDQSAGFTCITDGIISEDYSDDAVEYGTTAIIFDVKSDGTTEFHRVDFQNAKILYDNEEWVLDASDKPEDFIYFSTKAKAAEHPDAYTLKGSAPSFPADAWATVKDLGDNDSVEVTFSSTAVPASEYNYDYIRRYRVRAIPVSDKNAVTVTKYVNNDLYKPERYRAREMTAVLEGLDWNTEYRIEVCAMTGYGTASKAVVAKETVNVGMMKFPDITPIYDIDYSDGNGEDAAGHTATLFPLIKFNEDDKIGKKAAHFNGIGELSYSFNADELEKIRDTFTLESYFSLAETSAKQEFVSLQECAGVAFGVENDELYVFCTVGSGSNSEDSYPIRIPVNANEWVHLAVTYNSKEITAYVNGEKFISVRHTGGLAAVYGENDDLDALKLFVGARSGTNNSLKVSKGSKINLIRLYSGVKSEEEIKAAYDAAVTPAEPSFDPDSVTLPFTDIKSGSWFESSVKYVYSEGLMNGMSDTKFSPNGTMNRAMVVTVLWRMENSPVPTVKVPFNDLKQAWYKDAVAWAYEHKIVNGTSATAFDPNGSITREQLATILYRYSEYKNHDISKSESLDSFPDVKKVHSWAKDALSWAYAEELITGKNEGGNIILDPRGNATRAQVATILMRYCEK